MELDLLGIPKGKVSQLEKSDIFCLEDLLKYMPKKYFDFRNPITDFKKIDPNNAELVAIVGKIVSITRKEKVIYAKIVDKNNKSIMAYWFNQAFVANMLFENTEYIFCGKVKENLDFKQIQIFPIMFNKDISSLSKLIPVYKKIKGMSDDYLKQLISKSLMLVPTGDFLDNDIIKEFNLVGEYEAFKLIHEPKTEKDIEKAKSRFLFDDLFVFNFKLKNEERLQPKNTEFMISSCKSWTPLLEKIPFELTQDQKNVLKLMYSGMKKGLRLNALVQGDVGSGKTIVAVFLAFLGVENGFQSAIIAPTEVLAKQHYEEFLKYMPEEEKESVVFLSGSLKAKEKKQANLLISNGTAKIVIGTHAIIQPSVNYENLGLVVVDEQHRFGVEQRECLLKRNKVPHLVNMSATPIPRTMAMAAYGNNIQVFNILTKPNGRKPIITEHIDNDRDCNEAIVREVAKGHQVYIICPLIEDSESERMSDIDSTQSVYAKLTDYFKNNSDIKIDVINGDMKQSDINEKISDFLNKKANVLISTTIVEVGVNIPNATLIVIKNSERFGLAQLHQLRGRVGRSNLQSFCLLQTVKQDVKAEIMCSTTDGFKIAQEDLRLRGTGDFVGVRQSGANRYVMLMLANAELYHKINQLNETIYNSPEKYEQYAFLNDFEMF